MTVFVVNRLDDYFSRQQQAELRSRANLVAAYVDAIAADAAIKAGGPVVDIATGAVNDAVIARFQNDRSFLADFLGQADVDIVLGLPGADGSGFVPARGGSFHAALTAPPGEGQTRESLQVGPYRRVSTQSPWPSGAG